MPFKAYYLSPQGDLRRGLTEAEVRAAFESRQGLLWVNIEDTTPQDGEFLDRTFHFHHLAIEDCVSPRIHAPKIDDFGSYLFIIVHGIDYNAESGAVETVELEIFLGPHFVVSNHNFPLEGTASVRRLVEEDGRPLRRGADFLAHALIDALIDSVLPTIDRMSEVAEDIEENVIRRPQDSTLEDILKFKRAVLRMHRVMAPQREVLNRLSRGEFPIIRQEAHIFYRDVYDHALYIEDLNQSLKGGADDALAAYLSSMAIRQNRTMEVLTIVATIVLPLTLLAGIYGMNFENMPELKWRWGYYAVLGFMGVVAVGAGIAWFWARRGFPRGQRQGGQAQR